MVYGTMGPYSAYEVSTGGTPSACIEMQIAVGTGTDEPGRR